MNLSVLDTVPDTELRVSSAGSAVSLRGVT